VINLRHHMPHMWHMSHSFLSESFVGKVALSKADRLLAVEL
jgi:hypothetical protein